MGVIDIIVKYREGLLAGLLVTLKLASIIWASGLCVGSLLGAAAGRFPTWVGSASRLFSFLLSGIPVLIVLFWFHFPAQTLMGIIVDPFYTAALALSIVNIAAVADSVRAALATFPKQYISAARVYGLTRFEIVRHIQVPLLARQLIPPLLVIQVTMLQATLFASLISVDELFRVAQRINAVEYRPVEVYSALAIFFIAICLPLNAFAIWLQRRFSRDLSER